MGICLECGAIALNPSTWPQRLPVGVGEHRYRVFGRIARGESSDVFMACRDAHPTERVVLKVLRASGDEVLMVREWRALEALWASEVQGADFFRQQLPQPVAQGPLTRASGRDGHASVFRWRSGFCLTLADAARAFPGGLDPRAAVWMWRRLLELLGWVHRSGWVHGAVLPQHILLHERDHGATLVGWSAACAIGAAAPVILCRSAGPYYSERRWSGARPTPTSDLAMSARCMARVLGGDARSMELPAAVPRPLVELLTRAAEERTDDAWALNDAVEAAARRIYGPPRYIRFRIPREPA